MAQISEAEWTRIHAAAREAQLRSDARFALMVVPRSDRYLTYPLAWAGIAALLTAGILAIVWPALPLPYAYLIEAGAFAVVALALDWRPLRLLAVPPRVKRDRARNLARREFGAGILAAQDGRDGMLFFASLGERYVEIVASRDLHARVGEEAWKQIVAGFSASAKRGRIADGFIAAIESCAQLLETHFPKSA